MTRSRWGRTGIALALLALTLLTVAPSLGTAAPGTLPRALGGEGGGPEAPGRVVDRGPERGAPGPARRAASPSPRRP